MVVVAVLVFPVAAMDDQSYCTSCKAMKPAEKTLAASAHTGIDCTKCHIPPGVVAASKWRLTEAKNVWADYLGMPSTAEKEHAPHQRQLPRVPPAHRHPQRDRTACA